MELLMYEFELTFTSDHLETDFFTTRWSLADLPKVTIEVYKDGTSRSEVSVDH